MSQYPERERFSPVAYVLSELVKRKISCSGRLLGLVLAHKVRLMADGTWQAWRGRQSLSELTGQCTKTVGKARRELTNAGIFCERFDLSRVQSASGKWHAVARGVPVVQLVRDVDTFLAGRERSRAEEARMVEQATHVERLMVQQQAMRGQLTDSERTDKEEAIRKAKRAERYRARRGNAVPTSDLLLHSAPFAPGEGGQENLIHRLRRKAFSP